MKRAIIVHGMMSKEKYYDVNREDSSSNSNWLPWLQQQLIARDILAQTPEMPRPFAPDYYAWKTEFERFVPDEETLLVGHSLGGGFLIRWLNDNPGKIVGKVVLIAPWLDVEKEYSPLFDFSLRSDITNQSKKGIDILYSTNDKAVIQSSLEYLRQKADNLRYHEFINYGHFRLKEMKTREFPELLKICLDG